ncbi:glycerol-3-phosphate cytidylyltransferase [Lachnospiraceae bacterium KM106-2]|nr:glycerol-3-phosphate cytidylyltransferase [Lachnospiraceae bacterium KM106-2]
MQQIEQKRILRELPKGLIGWYDFQKGSRALFVKDSDPESDSLIEVLVDSGMLVDQIDASELLTKQEDDKKGYYDYIVMSGVLERCNHPALLLENVRKCLTQQGRVLIGANNRLGIRYFCGDRDTFTERNFDSIENYTRAFEVDGHAYAKAELQQMLEQAGLCCHQFYSLFPSFTRPQIMFAEDYLPQEELEVRILPEYHNPDTVFLEEERLYSTLIQNGLFHAMANGFLIECSIDGVLDNAKQITISMDRGKYDALCTIIREDEKVEKRAVYQEGVSKLKALVDHTRELKKHGIPMVDVTLQDNVLAMPYVKGEAVTNYFRRLLLTDKEKFLMELDRFWQLILCSSEHVAYEEINWEQFDPDWEKRKADDPNKDLWRKVAFGSKEDQEELGIILKKGYIDLVSLNCFYVEGAFIFYDQEFCVEQLPAAVILLRTIDFIYRKNAQLEMIIPRQQLLKRYHIAKYEPLFHRFTRKFLRELRSEDALEEYHRSRRPNDGTLHSNRQKINYSENEYQRIFRDIFKGADGRKLFLFGSGNFTKKFLSQFQNDYSVTAILDNNQARWGASMEGIQIMSPSHLQELEPGTYKVIICIKNFVPVMKQLKDMGINDFSVYDSNLEYARKRNVVVTKEIEQEQPKKYHVGYIAGVFDLFHMGHLNMFRRAKEMCDHLIVGVVNDESVILKKKTTPYIPFEERIEIVRSCRYVDEAVEIPTEYGDTDEAYRRYQFDVQFSGSDYEDDPRWLAKKKFLEQRGSTMVFFPYTQSTSSTKIKAMISKKLL